jgi:ankyrin repeat protein
VRKRMVVTVVLALLVAVSSAYAQTTDFLKLVQTGTPQDVQAAISNGADVNARDLLDMSPLMDAAWENSNPEVIIVLVKAGADINAHGGISDWSVLSWAAIYNSNPEMITTLLRAGADAKAKNKLGKTALYWAQKNEGLKDTDAFRQLEEASK